MKITAKCKSDIRYFAKVNNLNINNAQELQAYYDKVGFKAFMEAFVHGLFMIDPNKRREFGLYFSPDDQQESTQIKQFFSILSSVKLT